jgi:ubiquinone/menaquinone biosynthesis C-methylase UbiE
MWENIYKVKLDNAYACPAHATKEADSSIDCVFTFAAAHHFPRPFETLKEISRILKPGGRCLYLHEPASSRLLYPVAYWRANRLRPVVRENVLVLKWLEKMAEKAGLECRIKYDPTYKKRGRFETAYYLVLGMIPGLAKILPCTADFVFTKK